MLIKIPQLIFIFTLMAGTILACSSSSWLMAWVGLEINLMSFIPLLIKNLTPLSMELTIKYFLVQAMASMVIIFISISSNLSHLISLNLESSVLLTIAFAMKAGVAPFHFWFPQIMAYADWNQALLILTWQKMAPLVLISFTYNFLIPFLITLSALVGMLGGLNQTSLKLILTYSSIIHSSWLISISFISDSVWWLYFLSYISMTISIIIPMSLMDINYLKEINLLKMNYTSKILIFINILSLAGLPPFLGFFIKLISLNSMILTKFNFFILLTLIMSSLTAFYFYSRLIYSSLLLYETGYKYTFLPAKSQNMISTTLMFSILGNSMISFLVLLT